jgi:hypothetical protein
MTITARMGTTEELSELGRRVGRLTTIWRRTGVDRATRGGDWTTLRIAGATGVARTAARTLRLADRTIGALLVAEWPLGRVSHAHAITIPSRTAAPMTTWMV